MPWVPKLITQNMGDRHIIVDQETFDLITKSCVEEFLVHHPEFLKFRITQKFIMKKIAEHYLR